MDLNLTWEIFTISKALFIKRDVLILLNKIMWLRESTNTFSMWLDHLNFNFFWSDCKLTAVHLINRISTPLLHNKSPYKFIFQKQLDYTYLKTFGLLAYVSTNSHTWSKFNPRFIPCVFLGYPSGLRDTNCLIMPQINS